MSEANETSETSETLAPKARREYVLERLGRRGRLEVGALAVELGVAEETIRRDFRRLEEEGKLRRAHGGALPLETEIQFVEDLGKPRSAATPLSRASLPLVPETGWVYFDGGPDVEGLAGLISDAAKLAVVAGSVNSALATSAKASTAVISLGGSVSGERGVFTGAWALESLQRYFFDVCFIEVQGISATGTLLTADVAEAAGRRRAIERSSRVVALWRGHNAPDAQVAFGHLDDIDTMVMPRTVPEDALPGMDAGSTLRIILAD